MLYKHFSIVLPYSTQPIHNDENKITKLFSHDEPRGLPSPFENKIWTYYDENNLYLDWEAKIDSTFKKGNYVQRDNVSDGEYLRVQLITCPNEKYAYAYYAFPMGGLCEGIRDVKLATTYDWNSHYDYTNELTDSIWTVHFVIPIKDIRVLGKAPYQWSIHFVRFSPDHKPNESYGYPALNTREPGEVYFSKFMPITLTREVIKAHNYNISSYFTRSYDILNKTQSFDPNNIGMDFEFRPAGSVSLKAAFNPDFSEVPIDDEIDMSNTKYARDLGENRFFFTEDINAFGEASFLLYTRAIAQPRYAVKITGNTEHYTYALLNALDKKETEDGEVINSEDIYTIAALRPHTQNSSIQFDVMNRVNADENRNAWTFYANPQYNITTNHKIESSITYTYNKKEDNNGLYGYRFYSGYSATIKDLMLGIDYTDNSRNYAPAIAAPGSDKDNGFSCTTLWENYENEINGEKIKWYSCDASLVYMKQHNDSNLSQYQINISTSVGLQSDLVLSISGSDGNEFYLNKNYERKNIQSGIVYSKNKAFSPYIGICREKKLYYSLEKCYYSTYITVQINGNIDPYFSYNATMQNTKWDGFPASYEGDDNYNIINSNITLKPTAKVFIDAGVRYNDYEYDVYDENNTHVFWLDKHIGLYSTLCYEYNDIWRFYTGYRNTANEINNDLQDDSKQFWFKVNARF